MKKDVWGKIKTFLQDNKRLNLLSPSSNSQIFDVIEISDDCIIIQFQVSKKKFKIEKSRFLSAYSMLEEKKGIWVDLGSSRENTKLNTLEGRIKSEYNGKLNGLSTAPWIASILVKTFDNIKFNYEIKGQALIMTDED